MTGPCDAVLSAPSDLTRALPGSSVPSQTRHLQHFHYEDGKPAGKRG